MSLTVTVSQLAADSDSIPNLVVDHLSIIWIVVVDAFSCWVILWKQSSARHNSDDFKSFSKS